MTSSFPPPPTGVVRILVASLDAPPLPLDRLEACLSPDEAARMRRFAFPDLRARYAAGRGLLRHVLGAALGTAPDAVALVEDGNGRPAVAGSAPVAFNVSHSRDVLAIALVTGAEASALPLGVDVEHLLDVPEMPGVAERVFDDAERAELEARAGADRLATFHRLWTRKEACMKATGAGFALAPITFHVDADAAVQRVALPPHPQAPEGATVEVHDVAAGASVAAAVALGGQGWKVEVIRLG
jgi:4'-phosphopantetheinyl transferase